MGRVTRSTTNPEEGRHVSSEKLAAIPILRTKEANLRLQPGPEELMWAEPDWMCSKLVNMVVDKGKQQGLGEEKSLKLFVEEKFKLVRTLSKMGKLDYQSCTGSWWQWEKDLFTELFIRYGKQFEEIRRHFPNKSAGDILHYYYTWKRKYGVPHPFYSVDKTKGLRDRTTILGRKKRRKKVNGFLLNLTKQMYTYGV